MKWTAEAEAAMRNIHSAGLERVRERAEKLARAAGRVEVGPADVASAGGPSERGTPPVLRGYRIDTCFGARGCPNPVVASGGMVERIEALLDGENLLGFLERRVNGPIRHHHEFRVAVADCPNACSQPQIRDVGVIGACTPRVVDAECSRCMACVAACPEGAVLLGADPDDPRVDGTRCLHCGRCVAACPSGSIVAGDRGYRVQLAGRLGRHPRLARELPGIHDEEQVLAVLRACLRLYKERSRSGERFAHLFREEDFVRLSRRFGPGETGAFDSAG